MRVSAYDRICNVYVYNSTDTKKSARIQFEFLIFRKVVAVCGLYRGFSYPVVIVHVHACMQTYT